MLTVKDLRQALADLPDNAPVLVRPHEGLEFEKWRYNTREVHNAYTANDDRYRPNSILLIELGDDSP